MSVNKTAKKTPSHQPNGQFAKGNTCAKGNRGGGRKKRITEDALYNAFRSVVTEREFKLATKAILELAKGGDVKAYNAIAKYAMGLPPQRIIQEIDVTGMSMENWHALRDSRLADVGDL